MPVAGPVDAVSQVVDGIASARLILPRLLMVEVHVVLPQCSFDVCRGGICGALVARNDDDVVEVSNDRSDHGESASGVAEGLVEDQRRYCGCHRVSLGQSLERCSSPGRLPVAEVGLKGGPRGQWREHLKCRLYRHRRKPVLDVRLDDEWLRVLAYRSYELTDGRACASLRDGSVSSGIAEVFEHRVEDPEVVVAGRGIVCVCWRPGFADASVGFRYRHPSEKSLDVLGVEGGHHLDAPPGSRSFCGFRVKPVVQQDFIFDSLEPLARGDVQSRGGDPPRQECLER